MAAAAKTEKATNAHDRYGKVAHGILAKHGWRPGDGLGAKRQGIRDAIRPSYKSDTSGLGHAEAEYKNGDSSKGGHWWEAAYDMAAGSISVRNAAESEGHVEVVCKKKSKKKERSHLYSNYFKKVSKS